MKDLVSDGFAQVVKPYIDAQDKTTREILAPVETDETDASKAYQIGDQLILGGILYDVIAPISQHGIITSTGSGANIEEADNITEQINSVNSALTNLDAEVTSVENILGAKNLLPNEATTQVVDGNNFTVNSNGTITVIVPSNPTSANISLTSTLKLEAGTYKLTGCPSGGSATRYYLQGFGDVDYTSGSGILDTGNGTTFTLTTTNTLRFRVDVRNGFTEGGTITFKPMIRPASVADDTYVPYAMTNRELTDKTKWKMIVDTASTTSVNVPELNSYEEIMVSGIKGGTHNVISQVLTKSAFVARSSTFSFYNGTQLSLISIGVSGTTISVSAIDNLSEVTIKAR